MLYGQKSPVNRPKKKNDKGKLLGKNVKVIKHFQPKFIYHNTMLTQSTFPEVNSDFDVLQNLSRIKTVELRSQNNSQRRVKKADSRKPPISCNNKVEKNIVKNHKYLEEGKNVQVLYSLKSPNRTKLKSKSYIEERSSVLRNNNDTLRSKSFISVSPKVTKKSIFMSDSSSASSDNAKNGKNSMEETPLDRIKKELIINRIEGLRTFSTCSARKEKIENLRKEISLLIQPQSVKKPIKDFVGPHENYLVYNVNQEVNKQCEDNIQSTSSANKEPRTSNLSTRLEEKETQSSSVSTPRATNDRPTEESCCSCLTSDDSIRHKIQTANILINRVQETLKIIKAKQQPLKTLLDESTDVENDLISSEVEDVNQDEQEEEPSVVTQASDTSLIAEEPALQNTESDMLETKRPPTRRKDDERYISEKYRNFPKNLIENIESDYEIIKSKLNTISESSESSESKTSDLPNTNNKIVEVSTAHASANTETIPKEEQAVQVLPECSSVSTQAQYATLNQQVQTEILPQTVNKATETENRKQCARLGVQCLPPINIPGTLYAERILDFSINQLGHTELIYKTSNPNVRFVEFTPSETAVTDNGSVDYNDDYRPTLVAVGESIKAYHLHKSIMSEGGREVRPYSLVSHPGTVSGENSNGDIESELEPNHSVQQLKSKNYVVKKKNKDGKKSSHQKSVGSILPIKLRSSHEKLVLKSYNVIDNTVKHDPGSLLKEDLITGIDESVYKTFINPEGIPSRYLDEKVETGSRSDMPKVFNIGLYESKEMQFPSKPSTPKEDLSDDYEKISFSLTISTETSDVEVVHTSSTFESESKTKSFVPTTGHKAVLKQLREKLEHEHPKVSQESNIFSSLPNSGNDEISIPEFIGKITSQPSQTLKKIIPFIRKNVKLGTPIALETNPKTESSTHTEDSCLCSSSSTNSKEDHSKAKSDLDDNIYDQLKFNVNTQTDESLRSNSEKEIPMKSENESGNPAQCICTSSTNSSDVQKNARNNSEQQDSQRKVPEGAEKPDNNKRSSSSTSTEKKYPKNFTVMTAHVHGDVVPPLTSPDYMNVLKVAKNGRYKDEANLFCENAYPECNPHYTTRKVHHKLPLERKYIVQDSSTSDTVTSRKLSEGEVRCQSSLSNGEIYSGNPLDVKHKSMLTQKQKKAYAYKRRTYFNNWVTYYVKNDQGVNDSSWSSSK